MIAAMHVKIKARKKIRRWEICFAHEGKNWRIVLRKAQYLAVLSTSVRAYPQDALCFHPRISYVVRKNGKKIRMLSVPNFWAKAMGITLCKIGKDDNIAIEAEITFRDLMMAHAFVQKLGEAGHSNWDTTEKPNKITVIWHP